MPLPYKPWQTLRSKGLVLTIRAVGRDALIPPGLPLAQTPRADMESAPTTGGGHRGQPGNYGIATPHPPVGDEACIGPGGHAPPQGSAGGINPAPTNKFCVSGQTGTAAPHRADVGRDALIPPYHAPPQGSAGGINPAPTNKFRVSGQTGTAAPHRADVGRDALIPPDHAPPQGSAGGINPAPTNKFCVSGQTGTAATNSSFLIPNFYSPRSPSRSGCRNKMRRPWSRWS